MKSIDIQQKIYDIKSTIQCEGANYKCPISGQTMSEQLAYYEFKLRTTQKDYILKELKQLQNELNELHKDWDKLWNDSLDANWVGVKIPNKMWRIAKELKLEKDGYYGYLIFSGSVNSYGSEFANKVDKICEKYYVATSVREYQL